MTLMRTMRTSPGRFAIMSTKIDNPDVMKFELNTLTSLKSYCTRPDGKYPAPSDLFQLGQPDLPVGQIEVETHAPDKWVFWKYPYRRLERNPAISFHCKTFGGSYNNDHQWVSAKTSIRLQTRLKRLAWR
jgi:hypothetical protein